METKELITQALSARENAYAPYSGFMVAVSFAETGEMVPDGNQSSVGGDV